MGKSLKITALTCTGDRQLCLDLLTQWVDHQTLQPDQWLVIDDGQNAYSPNYDCEYYYRRPQEDDPKHTMVINIQYALPMIKGDVIFFFEDDEYYAPDYIKTMVEYIRDYEMIGICKSKYYYLPSRRYFIHDNYDHASLAQTAIKKSLLSEIEKLPVDNQFIDLDLWGMKRIGTTVIRNKNIKVNAELPKGLAVNDGKGFLFDDADRYLYVGMKGMPGRVGIGSGHRGVGRFDVNEKILRQWIPKDFETYLSIPFEYYEANRGYNRLRMMARGVR